nr:hypothetical protein Iba_chr02aCG6090 [Ipomoea batatas]
MIVELVKIMLPSAPEGLYPLIHPLLIVCQPKICTSEEKKSYAMSTHGWSELVVLPAQAVVKERNIGRSSLISHEHVFCCNGGWCGRFGQSNLV